MDDANAQCVGAAQGQWNPPNIAGGVSSAKQQLHTPRTFDSIGQALDRVRASNDQVVRMLSRIAPREYPDSAIGGANNIALGRPPYSTLLEQLEAALNALGKSLDELDQHV